MFMTAAGIRALSADEFGRLSLVITASLFFQGVFRSTSSEVDRISRDYRISGNSTHLSVNRWPGSGHSLALGTLTVGGSLISIIVRDVLPLLITAFVATQALRYDLRVRSWSIQRYFPHTSSAGVALVIGLICLRLSPPLNLKNVLLFWLALELLALIIGELISSNSRPSVKQRPRHQVPKGQFSALLSLDFFTQFAFAQLWTLIFSLESLEAAGARQASLFLWAPFTFLLQSAHQPINRNLRQTTTDAAVKRVLQLTRWVVGAAVIYGVVLVAMFPLIDRLLLGDSLTTARPFLHAQVLAGVLQALAFAAVVFSFTPERQAKMTTARLVIAATTCGGGLIWQSTGHPLSSLVIAAPYFLLSAFALSSLRRASVT